MKKNLNYLFVAALAVCAMTFTSCKDDDTTGTTTTPNDLSGSIAKGETKTLDADITYRLAGSVIVEDGGTLNIPAGTLIKAKKGFANYILVLQGGKININGTEDAPVVMTSEEANPAAGDWGGLVINGKAPLAGPSGTTGRTEISNAYLYGGTESTDNSGTITYLVLEYPGYRSNANIEHNGLTLNGVGSGTTINNVYVYESSDDGIEFFGGTVNVDKLLVVNPDDDMFDFTQGYSGTLSNAYGVWEDGYVSLEADPRGVEADGNFDGLNPEYATQSKFKITNVTFDLPVAYDPAMVWAEGTPSHSMQDLFKIRRNASAAITNALVKGTGHVQDLVDISDGSQEAPYATTVSLTNDLVVPATGNNPEAEVKPTNYAGVTLDPTPANAGCAASLFGWTGYEF